MGDVAIASRRHADELGYLRGLADPEFFTHWAAARSKLALTSSSSPKPQSTDHCLVLRLAGIGVFGFDRGVGFLPLASSAACPWFRARGLGFGVAGGPCGGA
jgi:hypothetical protein